jgi:uncharacterized protein (DUF1810 family)
MRYAMSDPHNLRRFILAQDPVYARVCMELTEGAKTSHWMWFIFPQHQALGRSAMAKHYGIASMAEAQAYRENKVLRARLEECTSLMLAIDGKTAHQVLRSPDDIKFQSSMTLFSRAMPSQPIFKRALHKYFGGKCDDKTLELLAA